MAKHFIFAILQGALFLITVLVHAQKDQSGFISIDCGISGASTYEDETTGITYVSDSSFVDPGENMNISSVYITQNNDKQLWNLRSFPKGTRNCYSLKPSLGNAIRYFIRARFLYGNYDGKNESPEFDLYLGVDKWDTIIINNASVPVNTEFIFSPSSDYIFVCLVNTNLGTPFISALELRPVRDNNSYFSQSNGSGSLKLYYRYDFGTAANRTMRYKDDVYGRLWSRFPHTGLNELSTPFKNSIVRDVFDPPSTVMSTAFTVENVSEPMKIRKEPTNCTTKYFLYMYFAELEELQNNQTREFHISVNDDKLWFDEAVVPPYLVTYRVYSTRSIICGSDGWLRIAFIKTNRSTLPPLVNAMEIYTEEQLSQLETDQQDVDAISNIKSTYKVKKSWQGDPCGPQDYMWDGLKCNYKETQSPRITYLDLSSSGLTGQIVSSFASLTMLQYLDLSNNSLNGTVPEILAILSFLTVLNLKGNNLRGPIPEKLLERMNNGLSLSFDANMKGNQTTCSMGSCKKKHNFVVPVVSSVGGFILLVTAVAVLWCFIRKPKYDIVAVATVKETSHEENESYVSKKQQFTYSEILNITNNLEIILGKGAFGIVYHGYLNGQDVAVKMLSPSSIQGHREFRAELKLLLRVHHKNLTALVGYCNEGKNIGLVYEYMAMGNLSAHLSGGNSRKILSWEDRLRIALDTAQGLEYLHNGCKPPIVHRDVKTTNILLNEKFQAKISDFGLSKFFPTDGTHVSTMIAGTPGYLDPEYYISHRLNETSDVYSYGVVLLEIITGQPAISKGQEENVHITQWVDSMLARGDVCNIVDPKLEGSYDIGSAWKAIEVSMTCVSRTTTIRPSMSQVVTELKECMVSELARMEGRGAELGDPVELVSLNVTIGLSPSAR